MTRSTTLLRTGAAIAGGLAVAHSLPALTSLGALRPLLAPRLSGPGDPGHVALTFDDGPDPASTPLFLKELEKADVRATFFVLGRMLVRAPDLGRELVAAGHEVAVHGWAHRPLLLRSPRSTRDDVARARDLVADVTGQPPRYYRPPYGVLSASALYAARECGLTPVLWTHWGQDWTARATPDSVLRTLTRAPLAGGTVLLHDSDVTSAPGAWRSALGALPRLLDLCTEQGLKVGPLGEHGLR
ncbi:peptidoglycan/xylan/chitin deacetylase (PgdA/CDA1 family) [Kitasatospora sp. MAP12-15]|uniref:polysaccharide deacetylase family protein n=1 Tax=unclassified Kitasatospora TaxID=2633591 RepID=UPI002475CCEF|nr:polysaccharide deacetylase family protein [Kitasatospora sp. MAP12-44]MDH6113957.1 peptidoglycan/xylan/chitin deacetylase (PgdA/CDA1 family) [Kitasatospora sp. MAP12-44]